jgi:cbb3-type cytochrome oxidase maturation protein
VDVVILLVFVSLVLVGGGLLFFVYRLREGDFEHGDRLSLAPLAEDEIEGTVPSENGTSAESLVSKELEGGRQHVEP